MNKLNATARYRGAVGENAIIPRVVASTMPKHSLILDFGSGKEAIHTKMLRKKGFHCYACDIGDNMPDRNYGEYQSKQYDIVFASNVINVQESLEDVKQVLFSMEERLDRGGVMIFNLPKTPNKSGVMSSDIYDIITHDMFMGCTTLSYSSGTIFYARYQNED